MAKKNKVLLTIILLLILLTGGAYAYGAFYFSHHFFPGSKVNGYNCSYMSVEETEALMDREAKAFALAIETRGNGREGVTAQQVGLTYSSDGSIKQLIQSQEVLAWFLAFNQTHSYDLSRSLSYNEDLLTQTVQDLNCTDPEKVVQPQDAAIVEIDGTFVIRPEVQGNALDLTKVRDCIAQAMLTGRVLVNLENEGCYLYPRIAEADEALKENCAEMNRLVDVIITYDFGRRTERVDRERIKEWFTLNEAGKVILDQALVSSFVEELSHQYDSDGSERSFTTYDGRLISISGGDFGWVIDVPAETKALIQCIEEGETQVREPIYLETGVKRDGENDIGYTYVEIDTGNQKLVFYEEGIPVIETDCLTGNIGLGVSTPIGIYRAGLKESPADLTEGFLLAIPDVDTFTSDASPVDLYGVQTQNGIITAATVNWWMPFGPVGISEGIAHSEYGPEAYFMTGGTTGNVEIPPDQAAALYDRFREGLPVVVY